MIFVCRLDDAFGFGNTPLEAFQDMENNLMESGELEYGEELDPHDCLFFEEIQVNITSKTAWNIEPDITETE